MTERDEQLQKEFFDEVDAMEFHEVPKYKFKLKPTYQFQSIEFEVEASEFDLNHVLGLYKKVLDGLMKISPEQEKHTSKPITQPLATDKQKGIMKHYGIKYSEVTTMAEAQKLIQESIENSGF